MHEVPRNETKTDRGQCSRCKKQFPSTELSALSEFGMKIMHIGLIPLPEAEKLKQYCPRCRVSLNRGVVFLGALGVAGVLISLVFLFSRR